MSEKPSPLEQDTYIQTFVQADGSVAAREARSAETPADQATNEGAEDIITIKEAVFPERGEPRVRRLAAAFSPSSERRASFASEVFHRQVRESVEILGGHVPARAVKELIDNLIHADFKDVVVCLMDEGNTVRISDKGPGIRDKARAFKLGYSGATSAALQQIRGIGAGLGIALAAAKEVGGTVMIDDNIGGGTVATVSVAQATVDDTADSRWHMFSEFLSEAGAPQKRKYHTPLGANVNLSKRHQKVLLAVLEGGAVGPSTVGESLDISITTAYRDLSVLEEHGLVASDDTGKRKITPLGQEVVEAISATSNEVRERERLHLDREREVLLRRLQATEQRLLEINAEIGQP